jgi:hypothetical protein
MNLWIVILIHVSTAEVLIIDVLLDIRGRPSSEGCVVTEARATQTSIILA